MSAQPPPDAVQPMKEQGGPESQTQNSTKQSSSQAAKPVKQSKQPKATAPTASNGTDKSLTGAELKKRAKEEKAAKRQQAKQELDVPTVPLDAKGQKKVNGLDPGKKETSAKGHHARTGSMAAKVLPLKQGKESGEKAASQAKSDNKTVGLYGHLYGQPRRTTIAGASKDVHPAILELGLQISNYVICGSSARCIAMLLAFKEVIASYATPPQNSLPRHLTSHLSPQIEYLISCRPLATSMGNAIRWLKLEINGIDPDTPEFEAKAGLCDAIDYFIQEKITGADQLIAAKTVTKVQDGDTILTFAKSIIVLQSLVRAHREGKRFKVIVVDSRPLFEGKAMTQTLVDHGLEVEYSLIHAISHTIRRATKVFLGAHSMMSNGRLYSRAGTAMVAMMAKDADIPVIVCCETLKFTDRVALDSVVLNEVAPADELVPISGGKAPSVLSSWREQANLQLLNIMYDLTPAEYIAVVITESGFLPPSSVPIVHRLTMGT